MSLNDLVTYKGKGGKASLKSLHKIYLLIQMFSIVDFRRNWSKKRPIAFLYTLIIREMNFKVYLTVITLLGTCAVELSVPYKV
jgi:hypothetical protein